MKKGFTLIELLAVIVILAIIAIIATPIILDMIEDSRLNAFKISIKRINRSVQLYAANNVDFEGETFEFPNVSKLSLDGKIPSGTYIIDEHGNTEFELTNGAYCATKSFEESDFSVSKGECGGAFEPLTRFEYQDISSSFVGYYEYVVKRTGKYKIQLWGASSYPTSGKGAYTEGEILLTKGTKLYFYIGGDHGYNGGGTSRNGTVFGGGATDVRLVGGSWDDEVGLRSRIMVAAGGGSYGSPYYAGTNGGALTSASVSNGCGSGGNGSTQTSAGGERASFGKGGNGVSKSGGHGGAGGGGYYGGGGSTPDSSGDDDKGGAGGTSFISGYSGSIPLFSSASNLPKSTVTYLLKDSVHYSGLYFINPVMKSGSDTIPSYMDDTTSVGNVGNGYGIIEYIDDTKIIPDNEIYENKVYDFDYDKTGDGYEEFIAPRDGYYTVELWGASSYPVSGKGAYTKGDIYLKKGTKIYIYIGGTHGYNGGGTSRNGTVFGGGATDVRLVGGSWDDEVGLRSRIMVAAGGGSYGSSYYAGTDGGALTSSSVNGGLGDGGYGSTQISSGSYRATFGKGGNGVSQSGGHGGAGGGGYYGGGGSTPDSSGDDDKGGAGGTSFISGHPGSIALIDSTSNEPKYNVYVKPNDSYHYSGYIFTNTVMKSGSQEMPSYYNESTMVGNPSSGHARITIKEFITITPNNDIENGKQYTYLYDKNTQYYTFKAPVGAYYTIELWGASSYPISGKGAYTKGEIYLNKNETIYIYVGSSKNGYNGGGTSREGTVFGGGATDVRLVSGAWDNEVGLRSRIMVAAGGGSYGSSYYAGTNGGALTSASASGGLGDGGTGATQISAGTYRATFGKGGNGVSKSGGHGGAGGGGYYGGGGATPDSSGDDDRGGAGGTSFISGYAGSIALKSSASDEPIDIVANSIEYSYHYSGYIFDNPVMKSGSDTMPTFDHQSTMIGNSGDGAAVITINSIQQKNPEVEDYTYTYLYTGDYQTFTAPKTGTYLIQLYGASSYPTSGKGAYTEGKLYLTSGTKLYVYVGGQTGYNGGGSSRNGTVFGGGATDVRTVNGPWDSDLGLKSRIMVAAGGGSQGNSYNAGTNGGALTAPNVDGGCGTGGTGATQTSGGTYRATFGKGGNGSSASGGHGGAGGGGYYGGGGANPDGSGDDDRGGAGGSSYISGYMGSIAITSSDSLQPKVTTATTVEDSYHYSGYVFTETNMISGSNTMPKLDISGTQTGNIGNGVARITLID